MLSRKTAPSVTASSPALQTVENLNLAIFAQADLDDSLHEMVAVGCHPGRHRAVAFANHAVGGNGGRFNRLLNLNHDVGQHSGAQFVLGIVHFAADFHPVEIGVNRRKDFGNFAFKHAVRKGRDLDGDWLSRLNQRTVAFHDIGRGPFG